MLFRSAGLSKQYRPAQYLDLFVVRFAGCVGFIAGVFGITIRQLVLLGYCFVVTRLVSRVGKTSR